MTLTFHSGLSKDFSLILNNADDFNVIIQAGENENTKEFRAHSVILRARSPYFKSAFSTGWTTKQNNMIMFNKPNITPTVFDMILKYIYTGELNLTERPGEDILGLLVASDELLLEELFKHIQDYLIENQSTWVQQNFDLILHIVFKLSGCKKLQDYCLKAICKDSQPFIDSKSFFSLGRETLFDLLKCDNFQIKEVISLNSLIKWGIKQTPELENKKNQDEWTDKNYEDLNNVLSDFLPLIKFLKITSKDFHPNNIYEEVMTHYLIELRHIIIMPQIESNIIKSTFEINAIANWIDQKHPMLIRTEKDPLYNFNLIYRGSRDGIDNKSFKNKCKGQIASLVLIKVKHTGEIYGGYSSIGFSSLGNNPTEMFGLGYQFYHASDNFIFLFENAKDNQKMKISRVMKKSKAILDCSNGFNFGWGSLCMHDQKLSASNDFDYYENNLDTYAIFTIEEIETFIVVKQ